MGKLKDFKTKNCKSLFCKILQRLLFNKITQILTLIGIAIISAVIVGNTPEGSKISDICTVILASAGGLLALIAVVFIIFAWVINPIKSLLKKKDDK